MPDPSAVGDLATVRRVLDGDQDAYRALVERHQSRVSAMMWRFSRDPEAHEDLVQEVFVQAYESLGTYRARAPFENWLARIATRVGYRHWRDEKRAPRTVTLEEWHERPEEPADDAGPAEVATLLHRLLEHLPPRDRLVLRLRYVEGRSAEETAELTGWSQTMVRVQAWRARRKLKALFEHAREEAER
jgi:RNA polymerase sigma-70 factor (ECF subfamily)